MSTKGLEIKKETPNLWIPSANIHPSLQANDFFLEWNPADIYAAFLGQNNWIFEDPKMQLGIRGCWSASALGRGRSTQQ